MTAAVPVLVSWIAVNNDPFERDTKTGDFLMEGGAPVPGPTLTILFDADSDYVGRIRDVVLLNRVGLNKDDARERRAVAETVKQLKERNSGLRVHHETWAGNDPTDHRSIFEFLRERLPKIRARFANHELVIHISPGTPSMQTIWVLMAETGFVEPPFTVVKSYRRSERRGRPPVVPVEVGIETFYKAYRSSHPRQVASEQQTVELDPKKFRTESMHRLFLEARRFAQVKVPVLILGERGTGKSTLASWIRLHSPYRKKELDAHWPAVACGQYNPETMRAELFGYVKGAFTGANTTKDGLLVAAHQDTLFLDEVGDVSRDLQRLLIKAIEEKRFFPLGHDEAKESDFRLVSATNLTDEELGRRLDPDFLDRVNNLTLRMPPLREIRDELPWLWASAYEKAAERAAVGRREMQLAETHHQHVVERLREHPLPGNMRDLFRVAYRILAARSDAHEPLSPSDAVAYGLAALAEAAVPLGVTLSRMVARAFADATPLDPVITRVGRILTEGLERDLRAFVATELRRIAKTTERPVTELCDVTERSLRTWASFGTDGSALPPSGSNDPKSSTRGPKTRV